MAIQRGEIYFVDLGPTVGREQFGRRPVLVLSIDGINRLPLVITVVIGTKGSNVPKEHKTNVRVPASVSGLPEETVFLCFQIRSLDARRFPSKPAGLLPPAWLQQVEGTVRFCLGL
jgi:mRNA interferase MazF